MSRPVPLLGLLLGLGGLFLPAAVHAQDGDVTAAATAFTAGQQAELNRDWARAAEFYELADQIAPSPQALRSAAKSRLAAGDRSTAATEAEELLRRYPAEATSVALAKGILEQAGAKLMRLDVQCKPSCTVGVDRIAISTEPRGDHVVYVDPGEHRIEAFFAGSKSTVHTVTGVEGGSTQLSFDPPTRPGPGAPQTNAGVDVARPAAADTGVSSSGLPPAVALTGAAVTVVLGGLTLWSGLDTLKLHNNAGPKYGADVYDDGVGREHRTNWLAGATAVVGGATLAVALFATQWSPGKGATRANEQPAKLSTISVVPRSGGAGLIWQGSF